MIPEKGKVLIDFYADWCGPCKGMNPILEQFKESSDVPLVKVNVDEESEIAQKFGIRSIPCFIVVEDGEEKIKKIGMQSLEQLKELVK
jgi:thioredoxin 1